MGDSVGGARVVVSFFFGLQGAETDVAANGNRHLMTGTGAYFYIMWGTWLRHCLNGRQEEYELYWPHVWSLPDVVKVSGKKQQMHANGDAKKSR